MRHTKLTLFILYFETSALEAVEYFLEAASKFSKGISCNKDNILIGDDARNALSSPSISP